jgi:hypothetical protein
MEPKRKTVIRRMKKRTIHLKDEELDKILENVANFYKRTPKFFDSEEQNFWHAEDDKIPLQIAFDFDS